MDVKDRYCEDFGIVSSEKQSFKSYKTYLPSLTSSFLIIKGNDLKFFVDVGQMFLVKMHVRNKKKCPMPLEFNNFLSKKRLANDCFNH